MKRLLILLLSIFLLLIVTACESGASNSQGNSNAAGNNVNVNMTNYNFEVNQTPIPSGQVTFHVKNAEQGEEHEMVLIKTDQQGSQLPKASDGTVDEDKLESMGEVEVPANQVKDLTVSLNPGHYVLLCNEPGHYSQGMYQDITVQ